MYEWLEHVGQRQYYAPSYSEHIKHSDDTFYRDKYEEELSRRRAVETELEMLRIEQRQTGVETPENSIVKVKKLSTRRKLIIHNNFKQHVKTEICT